MVDVYTSYYEYILYDIKPAINKEDWGDPPDILWAGWLGEGNRVWILNYALLIIIYNKIIVYIIF